MAPIDDGLTPKIGRTGNLDAKKFILGQGMLWERNISKNYSIVLEI